MPAWIDALMTALQTPLFSPADLWPASQPWQWLLWGLVAIYGLCVGSFLNVVALRQLREEEFVKKGSYCFHCNTPLQWYHNIPLFSYLALRGKCGFCGTPISPQYPLAEVATMLLFLLVVSQVGVCWALLPLLWLIGNSVVMVLTDIKEKLIFLSNSLSLIPVGLLMHALGLFPASLVWLWWQPPFASTAPHALLGASFYSALFGVIGVYLLFEGLIWLSRKLIGQDAFGHGDTLILMGFASFLGWEWTLVMLALGIALQGLGSIPYLFYNWIRQKSWRLIAWFSSAIVLGFLPSLLFHFKWIPPIAFSLLSLVALPTVCWCLLQFMKQVRQQGSLTAAPFGPALIVGGLICLFWGQSLLRPLIKGYLPWLQS